jgi:peptidoglycan hydrolase CwlO-like protein
MAELNARVHRLPLALTVLLSALVAATTSMVVLVPRPAAADQVTSLRAQATAVAQQLVQQQLQVGAYQQQYSVASARAAADASAVAQLDQQIARVQQEIGQRTGDVRQQAIQSYMSYGTGSSGADASLFTGNQERVQEADEYAGIAVGDITVALDQLRTAQSALRSDQASLQSQEAADQADQSQEAAALGHATATQDQLQALQSQVTGQLAAAVSRQAAAQAAAAAAAVQAAQRAATPAAPPPSAPTSTAGRTTAVVSGGDPVLNAFLQCVVQAESGGDYGAVSPGGTYMGAFQFSQSTWNMAALAAGRPDLVGVHPNLASKADQDTVAMALYALDGERPWLGDRCSS